MKKCWSPKEVHLKSEGDEVLAQHLETLCVAQRCEQSCEERMKGQRPLVIPIYQTTAYTVKDVPRYEKISADGGGYIYSRLSCPTNEEATAILSSLEGGAASLLFASGMNAITTCVLGLLQAGDHVVTCSPCYSGAYSFFKNYLGKFGVEVTFVRPYEDDGQGGVPAYEKAIKENTKMLYGETPINPNVKLLDLEAFGALGKKHGILTVVDSTFGSPFLQRPVQQYGIDISLHSCTKFLNGHSDVIAGCATFKTLEIWRKVESFSEILGGLLSAQSASLLIRGMKTLAVRMERHCATALELAKFLEAHPKVSRVIYPGLASHPQYELAQRQMPRGGGGMISFSLQGGHEACITFTRNLKLIHLAVSLGGVESLICQPATMVHSFFYMTDEDRAMTAISPDMIRFSVGLEHVEDLKRDLDQALETVQL